MTISSYGDLQAAVANYLARNDLTANIPDFITLAESRIFYGSDDPTYPSPALRIRAMEQVTDPTVYRTAPGSQLLALPGGFLQARTVSLEATQHVDLDFVTQKQLSALWAGGAQARPRVYSFQGNALSFGPTPDAAYGVTMTYYQRFDPLATTPTNWLLSNAPGIYLYAALLEAEPFLMHDERLPVWAGMLSSLTRSIMRADQADRFGGTSPAMRSDTGNP
jgi:hypothetical protein